MVYCLAILWLPELQSVRKSDSPNLWNKTSISFEEYLNLRILGPLEEIGANGNRGLLWAVFLKTDTIHSPKTSV